MTRVYCYNDDCVYCDADTNMCCRDIISVGDGIDYACDEYLCYLDTEEYGEEFYALVGNRGKAVGREKRKGKKIKYNGREFFSREKECIALPFSVTDAKTGMLVRFDYVKNNWDKFIEIVNKQPNIETFPAVEKGADGEYHIVEEGKDDGSERKAD